MSRWTHAICVPCWNDRRPEKAVNEDDYTDGSHEDCCFCGEPTRSGIYYRHNPDEARCKGTDGSAHNEGED